MVEYWTLGWRSEKSLTARVFSSVIVLLVVVHLLVDCLRWQIFSHNLLRCCLHLIAWKGRSSDSWRRLQIQGRSSDSWSRLQIALVFFWKKISWLGFIPSYTSTRPFNGGFPASTVFMVSFIASCTWSLIAWVGRFHEGDCKCVGLHFRSNLAISSFDFLHLTWSRQWLRLMGDDSSPPISDFEQFRSLLSLLDKSAKPAPSPFVKKIHEIHEVSLPSTSCQKAMKLVILCC